METRSRLSRFGPASPVDALAVTEEWDDAVERCLGEVERTRWEAAVSQSGGNVAGAALICGLGEVLVTSNLSHFERITGLRSRTG